MTTRLINWFTFNFFFALLPLAMSLLLRYLIGNLTTISLASSPEILFFSLMVSATALGDLTLVTKSSITDTLLVHLFKSALLFGAIGSACLYGVLLFDVTTGLGPPEFRLRLLTISIWIAVVFFVISTYVEIMIGKAEDGE